MGKFYEYEILVDDKPMARGRNLNESVAYGTLKDNAKGADRHHGRN